MRREPTVDAVVFDYGGVLTVPGRQAVESWTRAEGIRPESFSALLREWVGSEAAADTPLHRLETGLLPIEEFNHLLAARLRPHHEEGRIEPAGLLQRLFSFMHQDEETLRLVTKLRGAGLRTALLSNSWGNTYPWEQLEGLFEHAVVSGSVGLRKPDPEIYRLLLDRMDLLPENTAFVDDVRANVTAARRLGMHTVLHRDAARTEQELRELLGDLDKHDRR
ncbi:MULTISPECIES: HAD family phosphatase [unclassified Actinopolyspora]|uniref:HAD family hydrolase n=1 Tax=unclassified Actinopolyspora TaxID=2639451 RepID=UPI0013F59C83|nr:MULTISPECIES: HAD family phosphatase [unclassified Actinopolyspora]NHD16944.1 HAD family phosphatase [Actinopolyspora sp. BKK2]NHE76096.1 HAD family phosphatase [Actinopolyspora sp. BKK1]